MFENILFYPIFLSQILLISYYFPKKILTRTKLVLQNYPPEQYPKLYVKPIKFYNSVLRSFKIANQIILAIGIAGIIGLGYLDMSHEGSIAEFIPLIYFMIQILPVFLMEVFGFAYFKMMRKADTRTTRKAELMPRKLTDFVSPIAVGLAIFMFFACLLFFYLLEGFQYDLRNDTFIIFLTLGFSNLFFCVIIYWNIYGKKLDPYQAGKDRVRQIEITVKSLVYMSILASMFLILTKSINVFDLDYLETALMSVYLQIVIWLGLGSMLKNIRLENLDFDVYKNEAAAS
ncbi:MAG: hypothetical protein HND52_13185 [Ignavibacteriae bacterium]|nr:hypothetical protein [Ignavibacteriota bacterium]NOG98906.1 hypothetical protein [Ignavibacteriota bacterium]